MKDYNEMAQSVFARREKYHAERRTAIKKSMAAIACCCVVAVLGIWLWLGNMDAPPPVAGEQLNNTSTPNTTGTNIAPNIGNESDVDRTIWLSYDEVLKSAEIDSQMGVSVPLLIAYNGAIYGCPTEKYNENSQYALLENEVILRKNASCPAYQVKDIYDNVAIVRNGRLETYQKLFEVEAVIDGSSYSIVQPMMSGIDYSYGEMIQENDDFTVYQAINAQSGEVMEAEYVISILPLLKRELPNFFGGDENYGDAWWVAIPQAKD